MNAGLGSDLATMIEPVLESMGYGLVDIEFGSGGLLRITIEVAGDARPVQIEDCEAVSNQLGRLFMVENVDYDRLEISSPGLDRPLRKDVDFLRYAGERVSLRLRRPVGGRRSFTGVLLPAQAARDRAAAAKVQADATAGKGAAGGPAAAEAVAATEGIQPAVAGEASVGQPEWILIWQDDPEPAPRRPGQARNGRAQPRAKAARPARGTKAGAKAAGEGGDAPSLPEGQWLALSLDQIEKARLVPKLAF